MRFNPRAFLAGILFFLSLGPAQAQFIPYTTPGGPAERPRPLKDVFEEEMMQRRKHHVLHQFGIGNGIEIEIVIVIMMPFV